MSGSGNWRAINDSSNLDIETHLSMFAEATMLIDSPQLTVFKKGDGKCQMPKLKRKNKVEH